MLVQYIQHRQTDCTYGFLRSRNFIYCWGDQTMIVSKWFSYNRAGWAAGWAEVSAAAGVYVTQTSPWLCHRRSSYQRRMLIRTIRHNARRRAFWWGLDLLWCGQKGVRGRMCASSSDSTTRKHLLVFDLIWNWHIMKVAYSDVVYIV